MNQDTTEIAYCGMYCRDCWLRKSALSKKAARLLDTVKNQEFKQLANGLPQMIPMMQGLAQYNHFIEFLESACFLTCENNCRSGGGIPDCQIRDCCRQKSKAGCWECDAYKACLKLAWLEPAHPGAAVNNIEIIRNSGIEGFIKGEKHW